MDSDQTNIAYDLGILTLYNSNSVNITPQINEPSSAKLLEKLALKNIKGLIQAVSLLKDRKDEKEEVIPDEYKVIDFSQSVYDVTLPDIQTVFPRHKRIPLQKPKTRWEKFAENKGIQKKKRGRLIWDEMTKSWVPRYGRNSIKKIQEKADIIREVKPGEDLTDDPFAKKKLEKKLQKEKQNFREIRNKSEGKGLKLKSNFNQDINEKKQKKDKKKASLKTLQVAQNSTASMGLFDKKAHKEEPELKKKRKNNAPNFKSNRDEKERDLNILEMIEKTGGSKKLQKQVYVQKI